MRRWPILAIVTLFVLLIGGSAVSTVAAKLSTVSVFDSQTGQIQTECAVYFEHGGKVLSTPGGAIELQLNHRANVSVSCYRHWMAFGFVDPGDRLSVCLAYFRPAKGAIIYIPESLTDYNRPLDRAPEAKCSPGTPRAMRSAPLSFGRVAGALSRFWHTFSLISLTFPCCSVTIGFALRRRTAQYPYAREKADMQRSGAHARTSFATRGGRWVGSLIAKAYDVTVDGIEARWGRKALLIVAFGLVISTGGMFHNVIWDIRGLIDGVTYPDDALGHPWPVPFRVERLMSLALYLAALVPTITWLDLLIHRLVRLYQADR